MKARTYGVVSLFCGLGGKTLGFLQARGREGSRFESVGAFDKNPDACADFYLLTGARAQSVDLGVIDPGDFAQLCKRRPDVVILSPPCLPPEGLVLTPKGTVRIDSIQPGDLVLSHTGHHRRVDKVNCRRFIGSLHGITLNGAIDTQWYTNEHPIWARSFVQRAGLCDPEWRPAAKVEVGDRVGFPVPLEAPGTAKAFVEQFGDPCVVSVHGKPQRRAARIVDLRPVSMHSDLWFVLGAYIGDGHRRASRNEVTFSLGNMEGRKFRLVAEALERLGVSYSIDQEHGPTNARIRTTGRHLCMMCGEFGDSATGKRIPESLLGLELDLLASLLLGLRMTDGTPRGPGWRLATSSLGLATTVQRAMLRMGQYGSVRKLSDAGTAIIEGRTVNTSAQYHVEFPYGRKSLCTFEDGAAWLRVKRTEQRSYDGEVWNLEVDIDDTYCSPLVATHNCKGFSGCLPDAFSKTEKYQDMNDLALRSINLVLEAWPTPPAFILLENVPRMKTRGRDLLVQIKALLWEKGYETDLRTHDCGVLGGLAQSRERVLLVARHRRLAPTPLLNPQPQALRSMASVLWQLPVPVPGNVEGGRMHRLPRLAALNWLRLAAIRKGNDWRDLPSAIQLPGDGNRHAGKYGVQDDTQSAHTVISEARTGKGWADVSDPRLSHRAARQNGGFGVNDGDLPSHSIVAEGTVRNTWASVADPRLEYFARDGGSHGVADPSRPSVTVIGRPGIADGTAAIADPRSGCVRREGAIGVSDPERHYPTSVIANQKVENTPTSVADPRVKAQRRGAYQVLDPARPGQTVRGRHDPRIAPSSLADDRGLFRPTHRLTVDQLLTASRDDWTSGVFELEGPPLELGKNGSPVHVIIEAPDGTVHRPMTTLELAVLQSLPAWHRPGDPTELEIGDEGGQWLELTGKADSGYRERIGNAVPRLTAKAIGNVVLEILDAGATEVFRLSAGGVWVAPELVGAST